MARHFGEGLNGLPRDARKEFEHCLRAAELGSKIACYNVSYAYGRGVAIDRDTLKQEHYLKLAAIKGHIPARHNLGCIEWKDRGNHGIAVRHWMISASAGCSNSLLSVLT